MDIRAMVVDDSGIMRKLVMRSLTQSGLAKFTFTEAEDGLDALSKFHPDRIDMLFVDWNMPNMSGIDFVRRVRAAHERHVPIVMVTTESSVGKVEEAFDDAGVDGYITKPFTPDVLKQKLLPLFEQLAAAFAQASAGGGGFFSKLLGG
jgi:two-component system chemotaxis response regulator CheY